ncbi:hypothetical protein GGR58DRAFT_519168 [Xylaria digitata]|nr:hypothetical protein GGR58DRAFT_519168 [Xylaria digitata]
MANPTLSVPQSTTLTQAEREIQTLEAIADAQYLPEGWPIIGTAHDANTLIQLLTQHSLAIRSPSSTRVTQFVRSYYEVSTWNIDTVDFVRLQYELQQFFARLDELFFFNLLTRNVKSFSGSRKCLSELVIYDCPESGGRYGLCARDRWVIEVWLRDLRTPHKRRSFDSVLHTIVHELVHAYLKFADKRHIDYYAMVENSNGHGEGFRILLPFIAKTLLDLTNSEGWRKELPEMNNALFLISRMSTFPPFP